MVGQLERFIFAAVSSEVPVVCWHRSKTKHWLSPHTIKLIKLKHVIYRRLKHSFSDQLLCRYKSLRNAVRRFTRADYRSYAKGLSGTLHNNQKFFWNWIYETRHYRHPIPLLTKTSSMLTKDYERA